jgi:hypothetical protein
MREIEVELTDFLVHHASRDWWGPTTARSELGKVVVTAPLQHWHTFKTLELAYRDAYSSQLNDRYLSKWKNYTQLSAWASGKSFSTGIGMVREAIPKAEAPTLRAMPGSLPAATYWARVAWTNAAGVEGAPSEPAVLSLPQGSRLSVESKDPPAAAQGWNVYIGASADETMRQNDIPIGVGTPWVTADSGVQEGASAGNGQEAEYFLTLTRLIERG